MQLMRMEPFQRSAIDIASPVDAEVQRILEPLDAPRNRIQAENLYRDRHPPRLAL